MGIDSLIRFNLPHKRKLQFYGPKLLCKRICNRLNSYVWNLISDDAVNYFVTEITSDDVIKYEIFLNSTTREFEFKKLSETSRSDKPWIEVLENGDRIGAVCLNHINIDSVAYFYDSYAGYKS